MGLKIFINRLIWKVNPFKKEIIQTLDTSHVEKVAERFQRMHPDSWKIGQSKIEVQPLEWYFNAENIPNQNMIHDVYEYFETGQRKGYLEPLKAIGTFHIFYNILIQGLEVDEIHASNWLAFIEMFDLSKEEKHILMGIVLFWHGGYPVRNRFTGKHLSILRSIENEFLKYEGNTPEKEFCKAVLVQKDGKWYEEKKTLDCGITELIEIQQPFNETNTEPESKNKAFTTARQTLFMYYTFLELGAYTKTDKTKLAEIICFLTGKNKDAVYRKIREPFGKEDRSNTKNDLDFVISQFEKAGLTDIMNKVKKDRASF